MEGVFVYDKEIIPKNYWWFGGIYSWGAWRWILRIGDWRAFLGSLDIYENTGFEGYELAAYVGAVIGGIAISFVGVLLADRGTKK